MKVLHIFNSLMPSGAEKMWHDAYNVVRGRGVEMYAMATASEIGPYSDEMSRVGFSVYHLPHRSRRFLDLRYCLALYRFLRKNRIDAVQIHPEAWRFTNFIVARMAGVRRVVTTVHSIFRHTGWSRLRRLLTMRLLKRLGGEVVAIGDSVLANERTYGYEPKLVYNWIDVSRFRRLHDEVWRNHRRQMLSIPADAKLIALVGNCSKIKNHSFFLQMFARLPLDFYALHIGKEDEQSSHERQLAAELGVESRVRFLGLRDDVRDLLELSDVFVMCSLHEGLGIASLEALSMGLKVIVSDVPGLRDIAAIVPTCAAVPLDARRFATAVEKASAVREDFGTQVIRDKFDMASNVNRYLNLWGRE